MLNARRINILLSRSVALCFFLEVFSLGSTVAAAWTSGGPSGGNVNVLARSSSNPDVVYAGTNSSVFKSTDGGTNWSMTALPTFLVRALVVAPNDPDVVYAGLDHGGPPVPGEDGIYKTVDGGTTWTPSGLTGARVNAIAIDPITPNIVYAGAGKPESSYTGEIIGIFKSTNSGTTWNNVLTSDIDAVAVLQIDPENPSYVYAGAYGGNNFRKSSDGGANWVSVHVGQSNSAIVAFAIESFLPLGSAIPEIIYATVWGDDVYLSQDSSVGEMDKGETGWTQLGGGVPRVSPNPPWFLASDASAAPYIQYFGTKCDFLGCDAELYKRDPFDAAYPDWTTITTTSGLPLGAPSSISVDPRDRSLLLSLAEAGIYRSTDRGDSWTDSGQGLINTYINGLAVDPGNPETAFATVTNDALRLAKSNNSGTTWEYLANSSTNQGAVTIDPSTPSTVWTGDGSQLSQNFHVYKSEDSAQTWNSINFLTYTSSTSTSVVDILINPDNSANLLVGTSGFDGVVARTLDGGLNWQQLGFGITTLAVDPNNTSIVYEGKSQIGQVFKYNNVWLSTWSVSEITPSAGIGGVRDIEVDNSSRVYVAASDGLWRRDGTLWTKLTGLPTDDITALAIDLSTSPGVVFVGTGAAGVFVSEDGGGTWSAFNDGLDIRRINELRISAISPKRLYAGTAGSGVWSQAVDIAIPDIVVSPGNGGTCFIATAAYGSHMHPHVKTLRMFRDKYLLTNSVGRDLVQYYYRSSPPIADYIREHSRIRVLARWLLAPLVYTIAYPITSSGVVLVLLAIIILRRGGGRSKEKRRKTPINS
jgi:hypothetical protein